MILDQPTTSRSFVSGNSQFGRRDELTQNPLLSSTGANQMSPTQATTGRQFLTSFVNFGTPNYQAAQPSKPSFTCDLSFQNSVTYQPTGANTVKGLPTFEESMKMVRTEINADIHTRAFTSLSKITDAFGFLKAKEPENIIDRLFDISPDKMLQNIRKPESQRRAFGQATSLGNIDDLKNSLIDASDRDFDRLSLK